MVNYQAFNMYFSPPRALCVVLHKWPIWDLEAGAAEASAVDTFLSGPKEVDIFPGLFYIWVALHAVENK